MYRKTETENIVECIETNAFIVVGSANWQADIYRQWLADGGVLLDALPPYALFSPEHFNAIRDAAFAWMNHEVKVRGYDSIETCCSYYNSSVDRYRLEARAMVAWRDAVNQQLEQLVLAPPTGIETWDQVRVLLPQPEEFDWPAEASLPLEAVQPTGAL